MPLIYISWIASGVTGRVAAVDDLIREHGPVLARTRPSAPRRPIATRRTLVPPRGRTLLGPDDATRLDDGAEPDISAGPGESAAPDDGAGPEATTA